MTPRNRPLNDDERTNLASLLEALAQNLRSDTASQTQALLGEMLAVGFPSKASGAAAAFGNLVDEDGQPVEADSSTERFALDGDRAAEWATGIIRDLRRSYSASAALLSALEGLSPRRAVKTCERCQYGWENDAYVVVEACRNHSHGDDWRCVDCGTDKQPSSTGKSKRCDRCAKFKQRNGYTYASVNTYNENLNDAIVVDGVYHS